MTIFTHVVFAGILGCTFNASNEHLAYIVVGSFLPDIDNPKSALGKTLSFISNPVNKHFDHRKMVHSIFLWFFLYIASLFFLPKISFLFLGAISHIFIDCWSIKGVQLFQPFSEVVAVLFPKSYRVAVGSKTEFTILFFMCFLLFAAFYVRAHGGPIIALTKFIGSYETALKHYERAGTDVCYLDGKIRYKNGIIEKRKFLIIGVEHGDGLALFDQKKKTMIHIPKDGFFIKVNLVQTREKWNFLSVKKPSVLETGYSFFMFDNRWHYLKQGSTFQGEISYLGELKIE